MGGLVERLRSLLVLERVKQRDTAFHGRLHCRRGGRREDDGAQLVGSCHLRKGQDPNDESAKEHHTVLFLRHGNRENGRYVASGRHGFMNRGSPVSRPLCSSFLSATGVSERESFGTKFRAEKIRPLRVPKVCDENNRFDDVRGSCPPMHSIGSDANVAKAS